MRRWWRREPRRYGQFGGCYVFPPTDPEDVRRIREAPGPFSGAVPPGHTHAGGDRLHAHLPYTMCTRPECAGTEPHNQHAGGMQQDIPEEAPATVSDECCLQCGCPTYCPESESWQNRAEKAEALVGRPSVGVWAVYAYASVGQRGHPPIPEPSLRRSAAIRPYLISVHSTEVEALRTVVHRRGDGVCFLPWGTALRDAIEAEDQHAKERP